MSNALKNVNTRQTRQTERTVGRTDEVRNNAGGYVFEVSDENRLQRFLMLGTDGGTYYVGERDLTKQNVDFLLKQVAADTRAVVDTIVAVSTAGRAPKNSPALFAMAVALTYCDPADKAYVRQNVGKVARTSTHLFEFAQYLENLGGWGRAKRGAIADWYTDKSAEQLAYQAVKYRSRNGWTHRDLLRLSHVKDLDTSVGDFILGKPHDAVDDLRILEGFKAMQAAQNVEQVLVLLSEYSNLPWETIPTQFLKDVRVWKHLFYSGQLRGQALLRNVVRLARLEAFNDMQFAADYAGKLADAEQIKVGRVHPISYLNAIVTYNEGQVQRAGDEYWYGAHRQKNWTTDSVITDALDAGFYAAFGALEPAGKRYMIGQDVSGSMSSLASGIDLSCAQAGAAFGMAVARTEPLHKIMGFAGSFVDLGISARTSLPEAMRKVHQSNFGTTDCALPMTYALQHKVEVDTFVVITDNETWAGRVKPSQALQQYRDKMGINAKLVVVAMTATPFIIADPNDAGMLDVVGFDASAPNVITEFSR